MRSSSFSLIPLTPFRLDLTVWTLRRRSENLVDHWDGQSYRRVLVMGREPVDVAVEQVGPPEAPELEVSVTAGRLPEDVESVTTVALVRILGLETDISGFYRLAQDDPILAPLVCRFRGVKPPRYPTLFECLANAIACQQVTLTLGIRLLNRLVERYDVPLRQHGSAAYAFPRPEDLAGVEPESLRELGFSHQKARALIELAQELASGRLDLEGLDALDDDAAIARLSELRGIGRWSAEYALLRGLGRVRIFPGDDVGARKNLRRWLSLPDALDYGGVHQTLSRWEPYAGLVYFHLLLDRLADAGQLNAVGGR